MATPFDLSPEMAVDPLPVAQTQPAQPQGPNWQSLGPLAALIPAALARGGRTAVAGLLQGIQQGRARREQQQRQTTQDTRQATLDQQNEAYRKATIENAQSQQRLQYLKAFQDALGGVDSPDQVGAILDAYGTMGQPLGVERGALDKLALTTLTPSVLTKRRVEKAVKGMNADTLQAMMESQASLQDGERLIPFAEWSQYVAHGVDAQGKPVIKAVKPADPSDLSKSSIEIQAADALRRGDVETYHKLLRVKREIGGAGSATADPEVAQLRKELLEAQVENARRGPRSASARPVLSSDANRIAEIDTSLDDVDALAAEIGQTGAASRLGASLPNAITEMTGWGLDAKQRQAVIDRVKQVIGKALEGGVLRKEDEYKYTRILPTIGDPPQVAASKLQGLKRALQLRRQTVLDALGDAGYETSRFLNRDSVAPVPSHGAPQVPGRIGRFEVEVEVEP